MGRIEKSIEIKASPEKVWEMLALDRYPEWSEQYKSAEYASEVRTPEDKCKVGASCRMHACMPLVDRNFQLSFKWPKKQLHGQVNFKTSNG